MESWRGKGAVFINCPYDASYQPTERAIMFAVLACGFSPRSSRDSVDSSTVRLSKICGLIADSEHSLHDVSRTELTEKKGLPRFNMPLELGIFLGAKRAGGETYSNRSCLVLDREFDRYRDLVSDLAGVDISVHYDLPAFAIACVRNWLSSLLPTEVLPLHPEIAARFIRFEEALPAICAALGGQVADLQFHDEAKLARRWLVKEAEVATRGVAAEVDRVGMHGYARDRELAKKRLVE